MIPVAVEDLIIRRPVESDLVDFLAYRNGGRGSELQAVEPMDRAAAVRFLDRQAKLEVGAENSWVMFAIEFRPEGRVIGEVGVYVHGGVSRRGDMGWALHEDYRGRGYASKAARVLLRYAFEVENLHRVTASCASANKASLRLMERLGMRQEAHTQKSIWIGGAWHDEYTYALLKDEWID